MEKATMESTIRNQTSKLPKLLHTPSSTTPTHFFQCKKERKNSILNDIWGQCNSCLSVSSVTDIQATEVVTKVLQNMKVHRILSNTFRVLEPTVTPVCNMPSATPSLSILIRKGVTKVTYVAPDHFFKRSSAHFSVDPPTLSRTKSNLQTYKEQV